MLNSIGLSSIVYYEKNFNIDILFFRLMALTKKYAVVEVKEDDGTYSVAIVITKWLCGKKKTYWPDATQSRINKMLLDDVEPSDDWDLYEIRVFCYEGLLLKYFLYVPKYVLYLYYVSAIIHICIYVYYQC